MNDKTDIWKLYEKGKSFLDKMNMVNETTQAYRFYEGDHWHGLDSGGEKMPIVEVIKPIIDYKTMVLTTNQLQALYTSQDYDAAPDKRKLMTDICDKLGNEFLRYWELNKMDYTTYDIVMDSMIAGDAYVYLYFQPSGKKKNGVEQDGQIVSETVSNTSIMFADENERDIQKQDYILILFRRSVNSVKKKAEEYGCSQEEIDKISGDVDKDQQTGYTEEVDDKSKCLCVMKLWKEDGKVHVAETTKNVEYRKDTELPISLYPVVSYVWQSRKGVCRGVSEVYKYIPNQIWINRLEAYRLISTKIAAFPRLVYAGDIVNKEDIATIGAALEVETTDDMRRALDAVSYINPAPMSQDAQILSNELMTKTKDAAGASDVATGRESFDNYSALLAIQQSAAAPLARQTDRFKSMVEDIARIVFEFWCNYFPRGLQITTTVDITSALMGMASPADPNLAMALQAGVLPEGMPNEIEAVVTIPQAQLKELDVDIRIDISPTTPFNKLTQQQKLDNLLISQNLTFDEYVEALPDDEPLKPKLQAIVEERQAQQAQQAQMQEVINQQAAALDQAATENAAQQAALAQQTNDFSDSMNDAYFMAAIDAAAAQEGV